MLFLSVIRLHHNATVFRLDGNLRQAFFADVMQDALYFRALKKSMISRRYTTPRSQVLGSLHTTPLD